MLVSSDGDGGNEELQIGRGRNYITIKYPTD